MKEIKETMREKGRSTVWRKKTWPAWESNFWRMAIDSLFRGSQYGYYTRNSVQGMRRGQEYQLCTVGYSHGST